MVQSGPENGLAIVGTRLKNGTGDAAGSGTRSKTASENENETGGTKTAENSSEIA